MRRIRLQVAIAAAVGFFCIGTAQATILLDDKFDDGGRTNGADVLDTAWYLNATGATATITNNALVFSNSANWKGVAGLFQPNATPLSLTPGNGLRLTASFDFTTSPSSQSEGFKLGFFNSLGTALTADGGSEDTGDTGYAVFFHTGGTTGSTIHDGASGSQVGSGSGFLANVVGAASTVATPSFAAGTGPHTGVFEVFMVDANTVNIKAYVDNTLILNVDDTAGLYTSFNEAFIGHGNFTATTVLDNIMVESFVVPEPAAIALMGLSGIFILRRRAHM